MFSSGIVTEVMGLNAKPAIVAADSWRPPLSRNYFGLRPWGLLNAIIAAARSSVQSRGRIGIL